MRQSESLDRADYITLKSAKRCRLGVILPDWEDPTSSFDHLLQTFLPPDAPVPPL
jgi:hypothetical protein